MGAAVFQIYSPFDKEQNVYEDKKLEMQTGPFDIRGLAGRKFATFALNDAKYIKGEDSVLAFDVYSKTEQEVVLSVITNYGPDQKVYSAQRKLVGGEIWQKICITHDELKCDRAKGLSGWGVCEVLCIQADEEIVINNIVLS